MYIRCALMMRLALLVGILISSLALRAQTVTNVNARQEGQELVISYTLNSPSPCDISLFISIDRAALGRGL
jgi:hypothetical protein